MQLQEDIFTLSRKELITLAQNHATALITEAKEDLISLYIDNKSAIDYLTELNKTIHNEVINDFDTYGQKEVPFKGRTLTVMESGVKYDFSKCNHPELIKYEESIKKDSDYLAGLKKFVKTINTPVVIVDEDTGEAFEVRKPIKTSKTTLKVSY